jgi:hypothetical protein
MFEFRLVSDHPLKVMDFDIFFYQKKKKKGFVTVLAWARYLFTKPFPLMTAKRVS